MPVAHVNGINIDYELEGEGPETVVLISGLADDLETWGFQLPDLLAAGLRVLRFDNRGVGKTDSPSGPYTSRLLADDAKALVDHLDLKDVHLVGVSMGGMISQEYALAYGSDLRSLTLACTYAAPGAFCSRMFDLWGDVAARLGVPFLMRGVTLWAFTVPFFSDRAEEADEFDQAMADIRMPAEAYLSQLNVVTTHDAEDRVSSIDVPTLVLAGQEDILIPVSLSVRLHELVPNSVWATVPGGHSCNWERPASFNATLIEFIRRHAL